MQFENLSINASLNSLKGVITHAILRDDGRILFEADGKRQCALEDPSDVVQIALGSSGLWCRDAHGKVFHLQEREWVEDASLTRATSIGATSSGKICATNESGKAFVRTESENSSEVIWKPDTEMEDWLGPRILVPKKTFRFSIRAMLILVSLVALVLGPVMAIRRANEQKEAIEILEFQNCNISYAHQSDVQGNKIADPVEPGPVWLKNLLGRHFFLKPVALESLRNPNDSLSFDQIAKLKTLKEIAIRYRYPEDLNFLKGIHSLQRLELIGPEFEPEQFELVLRHPKLKRLRFTDPDALSVVKGLEQLKSLEINCDLNSKMLAPLKDAENLTQLKLHVESGNDISALSDLTSLEELTIDSDRNEFEPISSLEPLKNLHRLKSLSINANGIERRGYGALSNLTNLEYLELKNVAIKELSWISKLTKIRKLKIPECDCEDLSPLANLSQLDYLLLGKKNKFEVALFESTKLTPTRVSRYKSLFELKDSWQNKNRFYLNNCGIQELELLRDIPEIHYLNIADNNISTLIELPGFKTLVSCDFSGNPVSDIGSLLTSPILLRLGMANTLFNDTSVLSRLTKLKAIDLSSSKIQHLSGVEALSELDELFIDNTSVSDLTPIKGLKHLSEFSCANTPVKEFVLNKRRMRTLNLSNTLVEDISSIPIVLESLNVSGSKVTDISRVALFQDLLDLNLSSLRLTEISQIWTLTRLKKLNLANTQVSDISSLRSLSSLEELSLANTNVENISALASCRNLKILDLSNTKVSNLRPLRNLHKLESVIVRGTQVNKWGDLPEIEYAQDIDVSDTKISTWVGMPTNIVSLKIGCDQFDNLAPLQNLKNLEELTLEDFKSSHGFDWLYTECLQKLIVAGEPVTDLSDLDWLKSSTKLERLRLPAGSIFEPNLVEHLLNLESVHIGDEQVWFWKDHCNSSSSVEQ